jgi:hypothetical protein
MARENHKMGRKEKKIMNSLRRDGYNLAISGGIVKIKNKKDELYTLHLGKKCEKPMKNFFKIKN